jgi:hypothetical protein
VGFVLHKALVFCVVVCSFSIYVSSNFSESREIKNPDSDRENKNSLGAFFLTDKCENLHLPE